MRTAKEMLSDATEQQPARIRGCYLLIRDNRVVYVGQSVNVLARIGTHISEREKKFDSYSVIEVSDDENLDEMETLLILELNPIYNTAIPLGNVFASAGKISRAARIGVGKFRKLMRQNDVYPVFGDYYKIDDVSAVIYPAGNRKLYV